MINDGTGPHNGRRKQDVWYNCLNVLSFKCRNRDAQREAENKQKYTFTMTAAFGGQIISPQRFDSMCVPVGCKETGDPTSDLTLPTELYLKRRIQYININGTHINRTHYFYTFCCKNNTAFRFENDLNRRNYENLSPRKNSSLRSLFWQSLFILMVRLSFILI